MFPDLCLEIIVQTIILLLNHLNFLSGLLLLFNEFSSEILSDVKQALLGPSRFILFMLLEFLAHYPLQFLIFLQMCF